MKTARQFVREAQHDVHHRKLAERRAREEREYREREARRPLFEQKPAFVWHPADVLMVSGPDATNIVLRDRRLTDATQEDYEGLR